MTGDSPLFAAALVASGSLCFSFMGLFVKLAEQHAAATTFSLLAIRSLFGLALNGLAILAHVGAAAAGGSGFVSRPPAAAGGGKRSKRERCGCPMSSRAWLWLSVRCIAGFACVILEYLALQELPLAINTMIVYSSPAFIVIWAALLLHEPIKPIVICCLSVSMCGLVLIVRPWHHQDAVAQAWAFGAALIAAVFAGLAYVSLRELKGVHFHVVLNFFQGFCLFCSVVVGYALDRFPIPPASSVAWRYLFGVGASAYAAEVCITVGYAHAGKSLGQVSILKFLSPIFSALWGALFLGETPGPSQLAGSVLVLMASATILYVKSAGSAGNSTKKSDAPSEASSCSETWSGSSGEATTTESSESGEQQP